ncbi:MAG: YkvA family protein [Candidatus Eiseniibacteriota bacterium]
MTATMDRDERIVRDGFWDKARRTLGRVPFLDDAVAAYFCVLDRETPVRVRAILLGALAYFVLPSDAIPDILPGLGFTDDAAVLLAALTAVGPHIKPRHRESAARALKQTAASDDVVT